MILGNTTSRAPKIVEDGSWPSESEDCDVLQKATVKAGEGRS